MATKPLPPHGKRARYHHGCRCQKCVDANKRYCKQYRVATLHQPIRVDATPIIRRLEHWIDQGYSHDQIIHVTGSHRGDISKLLNGQRSVHPGVAARILSAPAPSGPPRHATTEAVGTIRRGRALHAIGYPIYTLAENLPLSANKLGRLLNRRPDTVRLSLAAAMTSLYRQLSATPGPSVLAVHHARRLGWHGPLAWDDIDDPQAKPETDTPADYFSARKQLAAARAADIQHLARFGIPTHEIAARVGVTPEYVRAQLRGHRVPGQPRTRLQEAA
ncbi:hypothetical protein [Streptomyces albus]|uniref:hypothetical protein n=1 Tax=Streptomyces albus TaxID=1888 RepID=UPI0024E09572|nr:hypothetical protein [Streptomyces albus]GHJ21674.1 hypothetical protein TPA0909_32880 [Streptomyces albus]